MKAAIAALLFSSVSADTGKTGCKCLVKPTTPLYPVTGKANVMAAISGGNTYEYPDTYGYGTCATHDIALAPSCADSEGTALASPEKFCA